MGDGVGVDEKKIIQTCKICNDISIDGDAWKKLSPNEHLNQVTFEGRAVYENVICPNCSEYETYETMLTAPLIGWNPS